MISKDPVAIINVISGMKLFVRSVILMNMVIPPLHVSGRPSAPPSVFETEHIPRASDMRKNCVVCYKQDKAERKTNIYCSAPQCGGKHMHITQERNCFGIFHTKEYHKK